MKPIWTGWLCALLLPLGARTAPAGALLSAAAEQLLQHQAPDGALVQGAVAARRARVVPYFANLGALGLVAAGRATGDVRYGAAARRWVLWYAAHQKADGTIDDQVRSNGVWQATGTCDATDAYAATFLELTAALHRTAPDPAGLAARRPALEGAVAALRLTLQPNGLTTARPGWPVMYTMDNIEVLRGLRAAAELAGALEDAAWRRALAGLADRAEQALGRELFDAGRQVFRVGLQTNGVPLRDRGEWYPFLMANLMAVAQLPPAARQRALFLTLRREYGPLPPAEPRTAADWDRLVWWGAAARAAGDAQLYAVLTGRAAAAAAGLSGVDNPATLGRLCRLLAPE